MKTYASTFISGLMDPVKDMLQCNIPDADILRVYDGLILYRSNIDMKHIIALRFFSNTFLLLKQYNCQRDNAVERMMKDALYMKNLESMVGAALPSNKPQTFRIITSMENKLVSVDKNIMRNMEDRIARIQGLKVHRAKPSIEFWFLYRSEQVGFFLLRLTRHVAYDRVLHKGELRPELCHIMNWLSEPSKDDIFLDPFCGYGAIPFERLRSAPFQLLFLSDSSKEHVEYCKESAKKLGQKHKRYLMIKEMDALRLDSFEAGFVDKVVTDPPWGFYGNVEINLSEFYNQFVAQLIRVLKRDGLIILLTAQKEIMEQSLDTYQDRLKLLVKYDILVSGKKASIYKIKTT